MSITVKYFASLKDAMGRDEELLDCNGVITVEDVWSRVSNHTNVPDNLLVAVNMEYATLSDSVNDGDEVAFFPPVTGG